MRTRLAALFAALAIGTAACGGTVQSLSFPDPPTTPTSAPSPPTLPGDLASIAEPPVPGATTTTNPAIAPGRAALNGTVMGPDGPVPGATVWADRFVGDQLTSAHATTGADGSWTIGNIKGGRYRVRAWQSPSLDLTTPQIVFLGATQTLTMNLQLAAFKGPTVLSSISPPAPRAGEITNLLVQVTNPAVGLDGVVRNQPAGNSPITLVDGPNWQVDNGNPQTTNADGRVLFEITCISGGPSPLSADVGSPTPVPLQMPGCTPPPTPTTTSNPCRTVPPRDTIPGEPTTTTLAFGSC